MKGVVFLDKCLAWLQAHLGDCSCDDLRDLRRAIDEELDLRSVKAGWDLDRWVDGD